MTSPILHGAHPAVTTAARELAGVLARTTAEQVPARAVIHLGLFAELPNRLDLIQRGRVDLHNVPLGCDAFECLRDGDALYLLRKDRAACQAIVAFCERLLRERPAAGELAGARWHTEYRRKIEQLEAAGA